MIVIFIFKLVLVFIWMIFGDDFANVVEYQTYVGIMYKGINFSKVNFF